MYTPAVAAATSKPSRVLCCTTTAVTNYACHERRHGLCDILRGQYTLERQKRRKYKWIPVSAVAATTSYRRRCIPPNRLQLRQALFAFSSGIKQLCLRTPGTKLGQEQTIAARQMLAEVSYQFSSLQYTFQYKVLR